MVSRPSALAPLLAKLAARVELSEDDRAAILALPYNTRRLAAGESIIRAGQPTGSCFVLLSGFAYRHNILRDGVRQVLGIHIQGDLIDLHFSMLRPADNNVQALTAAEIAIVPLAAMTQLMRHRPDVAEAMWNDTLADMSVFKEWIANVGRRNARGRIAHLICELTVREASLNRGRTDGCELPMTQEQLADTLGLTSVHVNRTLQQMGREGLIDRTRRVIRIPDWDALAQAADFDEGYLHLPQSMVA